MISEQGNPNVGDILSLGAGQVVPRAGFAEAIAQEIEKPRDKEAIRQAAQAVGSWQEQAARLVRVLEEVAHG